MYGAIRGRCPGSRSGGGDLAGGSIVARCRANPRATVSRWRQRCGCASAGSRAHPSASSVVIRSAPARSRNSTNPSSSRPSWASRTRAGAGSAGNRRVLAQRGHAAPPGRPRPRQRPQRDAVDFGVDRGGLLLAVAQHLADLRQRRPARSIWVAAVCRSRCAPTRGRPARSHAARTTHPIVQRFSSCRGAVTRRNSARQSHRGRRRR